MYWFILNAGVECATIVSFSGPSHAVSIMSSATKVASAQPLERAGARSAVGGYRHQHEESTKARKKLRFSTVSNIQNLSRGKWAKTRELCN